MGYERQESFKVHDPLGLIGMPMAPMTAGLENSVADYPKLITDGGQSTGVPTAVRTIGGALITALVLVGLVTRLALQRIQALHLERGLHSRTPRGAHIRTRLSSSRLVIQFASYLIEL